MIPRKRCRKGKLPNCKENYAETNVSSVSHLSVLPGFTPEMSFREQLSVKEAAKLENWQKNITSLGGLFIRQHGINTFGMKINDIVAVAGNVIQTLKAA